MAPDGYSREPDQPGEAPYEHPGDHARQPGGQPYPAQGGEPYPGGQAYPAQGGEPYPGGQAYPAQGGQPYPGGGPYAGGMPPRRGSGMAVAALVLGILGLITSITVVGGIVFGLLGIILGIVASKRAKRGEAAGRGMAIAGIATGALGLLVVIGLIIAGASLLNSKAGKNLQSCLSDANGNQAQIQSCNDQFRSQVRP